MVCSAMFKGLVVLHKLVSAQIVFRSGEDNNDSVYMISSARCSKLCVGVGGECGDRPINAVLG